jgi:outer membrane protein assembly factor BamE (lipoprotein component of BamABCDE complex)
MKNKIFSLIAFSTILIGCAPKTAPLVSIPARQAETQKLTGGAAQMIKKGMSGSEVIAILGTPNVLTNDKEGNETWVYDKVSNEYEFVKAQDEGWIFGPKTQQSGVEVRTQRTLIVVVNFDSKKLVQNIRHRQTSY